MAWLVRDGDVLAAVETARTRRQRRRGLLGRDVVDGVLRLRARSVHTIGLRVAIDVAFCAPIGARGGSGPDGGAAADRLRVVRVLTVAPNRITRPSWRGSVALEAEAGAFRSWGVRPGDVLEVR